MAINKNDLVSTPEVVKKAIAIIHFEYEIDKILSELFHEGKKVNISLSEIANKQPDFTMTFEVLVLISTRFSLRGWTINSGYDEEKGGYLTFS